MTIRTTLLSLLFALSACTQQQPAPANKGKPKQRAHLVEVMEIRPEAVSLVRQRTGSLKIRRQVRIHSQEEGRITDLPLYEGDKVKQGDLLAALDDRLLQAELAKAGATLRQAKLDLKRQQRLVEQKVASDENLHRARTSLDVAEAELQLLQTRLAHTRISAPFDGIVSERLIEPGDIAAKHHHLLTLIDPASLIAEVAVSELLLPQLNRGDPVEIHIDALDSKPLTGHILRIHPQLDPLTRQALVEVSFQQIPAAARAGQLARITFTTPAKERLMAPFSTLQRDNEGEFLYLLKAGKASKTRVSSGVRIAERVAISAGLSAGDLLIVRGFMGLNHGKPVQQAGNRPNEKH